MYVTIPTLKFQRKHLNISANFEVHIFLKSSFRTVVNFRPSNLLQIVSVLFHLSIDQWETCTFIFKHVSFWEDKYFEMVLFNIVKLSLGPFYL